MILEDIEEILKNIESMADVKYYKTGLFSSYDFPVFDSILNVPNVGIVFTGDWNRIDNFLILKKHTQLNVRNVPQRTGDVKFAVDQLINTNSIEIKLGGIYSEKENIIVAGRVSTVSDDKDSEELFKLYTKKIKKEFKKIGPFYVGKKAENKLNSGWRLVTNEKLSKEHDLKLF